jgi:hypothetical protein
MGIATISPAVVGIGAGTLVAAGLIAFYFALAGSRLTVEEKNVRIDDISIAPLTPDDLDPESQRPIGPLRTSRKIPDWDSVADPRFAVSLDLVGANYPEQRVTMRNWILVIRQYPREKK